MLWGHRNDPVNFHRCLQDFDRRLPDLLDALRDAGPADRHLRPRLRSDDALDRPLARARAAARLRRRAGTRPGTSTRTASSQTSARRSTPGSAARRRGRGIPGQPIVEREPMIRPAELIAAQARRRELDRATSSTSSMLGYARDEIPDYQLAAFCMAVFFRGLTTLGDLRADRRDDRGAARRSTSAPRSVARSSTSTRPAASATRRRSRSGRSSPRAASRSGR